MFVASLEVDQRQRLILQSNRLREMLGASRLIERTVEIAYSELKSPAHKSIQFPSPVSGVLRFTCPDRDALSNFLWALREKIIEDLHLPSTISIVEYSGIQFGAALNALETEVRANKDAKSGESARPFSSLFAQCEVQPHLGANVWRPSAYRAVDSPHRALISLESKEREEESDGTLLAQYKSFAKLADFRKQQKKSIWEALPNDFADLAPGDDSYLAFIKADGDGMGRMLMNIPWDSVSKEKDGATVCREFTEALEQCLESSTKDAVDAVTSNWRYSKRNRFPVAPLVRAGEDFWIVCRRELAFPLASMLDERYRFHVERSPILQQACNAIAPASREVLSLSFGILFVKQGFPFEAQLHMTESLVRNAKNFRRTLAEKEGCIDYYWLESSAREEVPAYREQVHTIREQDHSFQLFTTPWTLSESDRFIKAAKHLVGSGIGARKLRQLETIARLGAEFRELAFERWHLKLDDAGRKVFAEVLKLLPQRCAVDPDLGPFHGLQTPICDVLRLAEIVAPHEPNAPREAGSTDV